MMTLMTMISLKNLTTLTTLTNLMALTVLMTGNMKIGKLIRPCFSIYFWTILYKKYFVLNTPETLFWYVQGEELEFIRTVHSCTLYIPKNYSNWGENWTFEKIKEKIFKISFQKKISKIFFQNI